MGARGRAACRRGDLHNRREEGAIIGLTPTPHDTGQPEREQGLSKAGNRHVPAMAIEIAWG
jgi:transposase